MNTCIFNQTTFGEIMKTTPLRLEFRRQLSIVNQTGLLTQDALAMTTMLSNGTKTTTTNHIQVLKPYCQKYPFVPEYAHFFLEFYYVLIPKEKQCIPKLPDGDPLIPLWLNIMITMIFFIVGVIGVVGNLLTVWVIYKNKSLQTHTNYFLASLALSDMLLILVGVPFDIIHRWFPNQSPPIPGYCEFTSTTISFFTFVSILTIVALTGERYSAICKPLSILKFDKQRVRRIIYLIWFVALIPSLYLGMQYKQVVEDFCGYNRDLGVGLGYCDYVTSPNDLFRYPFELAMVVTFVLPMLFIMYCYARILQTLNTTKLARNLTVHIPLETTKSDTTHGGHRSSLRESLREKFSGQKRPQQSQDPKMMMQIHHKNSVQLSQQAHRMVIKMLVTVSMTFFICYLPYHLERLIAQYIKNQCKRSLLCLLLYPITGLLQYVSATLNPIFYNLMSERFRVAFKGTFDNIFRRKKEYHNINGGASQRHAMRVFERRGTRCTELVSTTESPGL